ncbi:unnamed protein product [Miscanthus lutarioriparius]|uniref:Exocyst subunit Exo70 family protein n=1 Tax=Miscanthus lutarioriparius TaxID=422564 RepID=A0A811P3L0_9POAL|nr:unnamed protein product [Miscanthus lutarioriparius]
MPREPWQRAHGHGSLGPRHHRSTSGLRRGLFRPREGEEDGGESHRDDRVRGGRLGLTAGSQFPSDMEGRVHGGYPSRRYYLPAAGDSCVRGGYPASTRYLTVGDSSRPSMASRAREKADSLERELHSIERSIVIPICLNPESREFFPDRDRGTAQRLDRYLAAAKRLERLDTSGDIDQRKKSLLETVMSCLADEFCHLKVWRLDDATARDHSPASLWDSARRSRSGSQDSARMMSSSSSGSFTTGSGGTSDASYGSYHRGLGEEPSVQSHSTFAAGMIYVDRRSLSILRDIASVMIGSGYEYILRGAFDRHGAQLARYIEILDIDNIFGYQMEESREILLKVWTSAVHIIISFLNEMQRQLDAHDFGSFDKIKEEYFLAIAKVTVMKLLDSANYISFQVDPPTDQSCKNSYGAAKRNLSKMVDVVMVYQALDHGLPTILSLLSGKTKELVVAKGAELIKRLSDMFAKLSDELNNTVRSQYLFITDTGVHRFTKHVMDHIRLLVQHKRTIYPMLEGGLESFGELVTRLIWSLEFMLNVNSRSLQLQGQEQIFLLNNVHFMLEEAEKNIELVLILRESWFLRCQDQIDQFIAGYVDVSWTPVMSSLERKTRFSVILWPHQLLCKFTSAFEVTCSAHKHWKVSDPLMRHKLREAISHKVLPSLYRMHVECDSEKMNKSARYSIEQIESQLLELFEG